MGEALTVQPLSREAFAPFGEVLETDGAELRMINQGTTERFHALARAELDPSGTAIVSLFRGQPRSFPYQVTMMERHPLGSQAFFPLDNRPWLVIAAGDEDGRPGRPQAFLAHGRQGVNYRANVWHHPLMALNETSTFLVVDRDGEGTNLEEIDYPAAFVIESGDWAKA
ncbi:ureidoglycolate lyase [Nitratireductor sp. XY-223]|uniref:ureidoglycolate lyase n=1 Tax=Nitratireductor sp. XY-223 TaxID=2561926 RepID=UPI0010AB49E2|nr:ureidoglycolate lyase [Nitratireductor sp. XY-223]